jgi:hypothetical protein
VAATGVLVGVDQPLVNRPGGFVTTMTAIGLTAEHDFSASYAGLVLSLYGLGGAGRRSAVGVFVLAVCVWTLGEIISAPSAPQTRRLHGPLRPFTFTFSFLRRASVRSGG